MDQRSDIRALRDRIETLEEENRQLREKYLPRLVRYPGLWRSESVILSAMESVDCGQICTTDYLLDCLVMSRNTWCDEAQPKTIAVYICRIRKKIAPLVIHTMRGDGYWIDEDTKMKLRELRSEN